MAQRLQHEGHLILFTWSGFRYLYHEVTHEVVKLPSVFRGCTLRFDGGDGILGADGEQVWAHTHLKKHVFVLQEGGHEIRSRVDGVVQTTSPPAFRDTMRFATLAVDHAGTVGGDYEVWAQRAPVGGHWLWWNLKHLYGKLGGDRKFGVVRKKLWHSWSSFCRRAGMPETSLLMAAPLESEAAVPGAATSPAPWPSAATGALLLLLARWSSSDGLNGRVDELEVGALLLLDRLLAGLPPRFDFKLCLGAGAWRPPFQVVGCEGPSVVVPVINGHVDAEGLVRDHAWLMQQLLPAVETIPQLPLVRFLMADPCLQEPGQKVPTVLHQAVWQLAPFVEASLLGVAPEVLSGLEWFESSSLKLVGNRPAHSRVAFLAAYTQETAKFIVQEDVVCVALDDGRLGRKPVKLLPIGFCSRGVAAWLCPQARAECFEISPAQFSKQCS